MKKATLPVALIQERNHGDADANLSVIEQRVAEAAKQGARLIVLQELHNGAYFCQHESVDEFDLAEPIPGPSTERLGRLAQQHGVVLVSSLFERRAAGLYHNTAVVFDADGSTAGRYRKMHIPDDPGFYEKFYFTPGDLGFHPIDTSVGRLGVLVCWDQWYPEAARLMALAGAELLLYPTAIGWDPTDDQAEKFYFTPGDLGFNPIDTSVGRLGVLVCWDQWYPEAARLMALAGAELLLYPTAIGWDPTDDQAEKDRQRNAWILSHRGHAVANGLPVLSCNRVGHEPSPLDAAGIDFWGSSHVLGPQGEFLAETKDGPEILMAEVDLARSEQVRRIWPFLRDRRIDAYGDLLKRYRD